MLNLLLTADAEANPGSTWWVYLILIALVLVMLVVPSISNRKRAKEYNNMINNISVGDTIRTVGGIIGRIVKINEKDGYKTFILETGAKNNKTTMEFDMASVYVVLNSKNKPAEQVKEEAKVEESKTETVEEKEQEPAQVKEEVKVEKTKKTAKKSTKKDSK